MVSTVSARGGIASCCRKISLTEVHQNHLQSYYVQHRPPCPLKAVVFTMLNGNRICSDPHSLWTQRSMAFLDKKKKPLSQRLLSP
ncbi:monocyte chemotactic protein 1B-like [Solea senegalensis]|nr:monocyte chemotactic protein 1B-like [Solea senegalensis]